MASAMPKIDDDDPWLAADKLEHFLFCFVLACVGFALASKQKGNPTPLYRLLAGALLAFLGGALKELGDYLKWWPGRPSLRDAAADAAGAAFGLAACAAFVAVVSSEEVSLGDRILEWATRSWRSTGGKARGEEHSFNLRGSRGEGYRGLEMLSSSDTKV